MSEALEVVQSGSFCWNEQCPEYGEVGAGNMRRFGKTAAGVQRFQCRSCRKVCTATRGTPFYGIHDPEKMLRALALLAERVSIRGVGRATGAEPDAGMGGGGEAGRGAGRRGALALLAERVSIRGVGRATGAKPDAVIEWMEKAARHVGLIEKMLQQRHQVTRAQLDALWAFVGHKGEKGGERRKRSGAVSGVPG